MIHTENTWVQKKVVPNLNVQILYMDGPYLPKGADQVILEDKSEDNKDDEKELTYTPTPYIKSIDKDGFIILDCLDPRATIYCFFDYSIRPVRYTKSQEFTYLWKRAHIVLAYAYGPLGVSKTVKLKDGESEPVPEPEFHKSFSLDFSYDFD